MSVLRKNSTVSLNNKQNAKDFNVKDVVNKNLKRKKIGFGRREKINYKDYEIEKIIDNDKEFKNKISQNIKNEETIDSLVDKDYILEDNSFFNNKNNDENINYDFLDKMDEWSKFKRKTYIKKDMKDKPVFLEDTGEKIGVVFDSIYDDNQNLIGFKIKDSNSDSVLSFSLDQFNEDKRGLIFIPNWYIKGVKSIEKLEFKDRICPELTWLLKDKTISEEELYKIFIKHDDEVSSYIDDAFALRELLNGRLQILEKERLTLKEDLMDLTEKRLIKDIDRREFSEEVINHRKKVNVLDVNIKKSKELIQRLEETSFGILSRDLSLKFNKKTPGNNLNKKIENESNFTNDSYKDKYNELKIIIDELIEENNLLKSALEKKIENPFVDKYNILKKDYQNLQEEYGELKIAVEKLLHKYEM